VTYIPHRDLDDGRVRGFFALTSDISDRKAIERMKDEFISVVSHELRTPLTSLHSALKILATGRLGTLPADGQQLLSIADENTERLVRLVNPAFLTNQLKKQFWRLKIDIFKNCYFFDVVDDKYFHSIHKKL
jgi:signal transduction histidine kinase